jgi:hypothetical protein
MSKLSRLFCRALKINIFKFKEGHIIHYRSFRCTESIRLADIVSWSVQYGMLFDDVSIYLKDGRLVVWEDEYNDLLEILRTFAGKLEVEHPIP